ncbi:Rhodanese-like domain-containing protein [Lactarius hengduanensis]|nr:Rhodanese-like domain-containing protein [Lactarius pseudohatsudake]KAH9049460.1 Rhodanese-like domain-containing protein [Lactarius hengduanensis]
MLRTIVLSAARSRPSTHIPRPLLVPGLRFNSSRTSEERKAHNKAKEDLQKDWVAPILTYEQVKRKSQQPSEDAYLIDVREPDEVLQGMIPSAVNLPLSGLSGALHLDGEKFKETHGFQKPALDQEIIFYCRSGMRSSSASDVARRNGYKNILNYKGSWLDWKAKEGGQSS